MSMPDFPELDPTITLETSLVMILISIAMEELGLSHIINAEGEKIQYALAVKASIEETIAVNNSVKNLIDSVVNSQSILKDKMKSVIELIAREKCTPGPPGEPGPPGPIGPPGGSRCCVIAFNGRNGQQWRNGYALQWNHSERDDCCSEYLDCEGHYINLHGGRFFVVNFTIDARAEKPIKSPVSIALQLMHAGKRNNIFTCHAPAACTDGPVTLTGAGIFVPAEPDGNSRLSLVLQAPEVLTVNHASICVTEI